MIGVVFGALAKADPKRATAAPFGTINALSSPAIATTASAG